MPRDFKQNLMNKKLVGIRFKVNDDVCSTILNESTRIYGKTFGNTTSFSLVGLRNMRFGNIQVAFVDDTNILKFYTITETFDPVKEITERNHIKTKQHEETTKGKPGRKKKLELETVPDFVDFKADTRDGSMFVVNGMVIK
jgi:hypothetical protein